MFKKMEIKDSAAFAELMDILLAAATLRNAKSLRGSFAKKTVKGNDYWYYQFTDVDGKPRQVYIGPESDRVRELIEAAHAGKKTDDAHLQETIARAVRAGYATTPVKQFKIISRLADYGFFAAGGVLAGTHAFLAIGNLLGVRWQEEAHTQDVDFAHAGKNISIALPSSFRVDLYDAIESLEMGFVPLSTFGGKYGATYVNPESKEERIDFLTPVTGLSANPVYIESMGIALQPMKFMELSLSRVARSAILSSAGTGAVAVNVPDPALFAIHKLIVAVLRGVADPKSAKDITQAAAIIDYYAGHGQTEFQANWQETAARGPSWKKHMTEGLKRLEGMYPEVHARIAIK
jgi:hypothetical protein